VSHVILDALRAEGVVGVRTDYDAERDRQTVRMDFARGVPPLDHVVDLVALRAAGVGRDTEVLRDELRRVAGEHRERAEAERERERAEARAEFARRAPDLMDEVVGFRQWNVREGRLLPIGQGAAVWRGAEEVHAECTSGRTGTRLRWSAGW
jgi:uncharacterized protein YbjQ (UPF0145 family)